MAQSRSDRNSIDPNKEKDALVAVASTEAPVQQMSADLKERVAKLELAVASLTEVIGELVKKTGIGAVEVEIPSKKNHNPDPGPWPGNKARPDGHLV